MECVICNFMHLGDHFHYSLAQLHINRYSIRVHLHTGALNDRRLVWRLPVRHSGGL